MTVGGDDDSLLLDLLQLPPDSVPLLLGQGVAQLDLGQQQAETPVLLLQKGRPQGDLQVKVIYQPEYDSSRLGNR